MMDAALLAIFKAPVRSTHYCWVLLLHSANPLLALLISVYQHLAD